MEDEMEYPEEIYSENGFGLLMTANQRKGLAGWGRRHAYLMGYEAGKAGQLAGYSNLTAAISAGEPIDWEKLDGKRVQCMNHEVGTLRGTLKRDLNLPIDNSTGWWDRDMDEAYTSALCEAWDGVKGWTLWLEDEIPLRRKTADQLKVGTYFQGVSPNREIFTLYVGEMAECGQVSIHYTPTMIKSPHKASEWVVLEEYGPFQKPEGK